MAEVSKKKKIRGGHKGFITKKISEVHGLAAEENITEEIEIALKQLRIILNEKLETLSKLDDEILELIKEEEINDEIAESGDFRANVHQAIIKIDNVFKRSEEKKLSTASAIDSPDHANATPNGTSKVTTKLPKLQIKTFSGHAYNWQSFWDSYRTSIHENKSLNNIDRFNYLRSYLEGPALAAINGFSLTETNYDSAIELLTTRFGNTQFIISSHYEELLKIPNVVTSGDARKIRKLYDAIETHTRGLQGLGINAESYGSFLVPVLLSKLPEDIKLVVSRQIEGENWKLDKLLEILKSEVEARERCTFMNINNPASKSGLTVSSKEFNPSARNFTPRGKYQASASALFTSSKNAKSPYCLFCKQAHFPADCHIVTSLNERKNILKKLGRCFICTRRGHVSHQCDTPIKCNFCKEKHHAALCPRKFKSVESFAKGATSTVTAEEKVTENIEEKKGSVGTVGITNFINSGNHVFLQTAKGVAINDFGETSVNKPVRLIFDSASQYTFVTKEVIDTLKLNPVRTERLLLSTFGNKTEEIKNLNVFELTVKNPETGFLHVFEAYEVPMICNDLVGQDLNYVKQNFVYLQGINFSDETPPGENLHLDILIGSDLLWTLLDGHVLKGERGEPVAVLTKFGWTIAGPCKDIPKANVSTTNFVSAHVLRLQTRVMFDETQSNLAESLERLYELETIGIDDKDSVHEALLKNIEFIDGRYSVSLPWRESHKLLPDNYNISVARLNSLVKRLRKTPEVLQNYDSIIKDQLKNNIIEPVDPLESCEVGKVHYLPHHCVIREESSSTRQRIVYNASMKCSYQNPSLNDCLHIGPSLCPTILDILLRFREKKVAVVADIKKAFLNIDINAADRNVLRFLWISSIEEENPTIVAYRFRTVPFGVGPSPFLMNGTLRHHLDKYVETEPELIETLRESFYVDDMASGDKDEEAAFIFYQKSKQCLAEGSFELCKWHTNSEDLMKRITSDQIESQDITSIEEDDTSYAKYKVGCFVEPSVNEETKILGITWHCYDDTFLFKLCKILEFASGLVATKRNILSLASRLYDPLGICSPLFIRVKILLQDISRAKYGWDTPLPEYLNIAWKKWLSDLAKVGCIVIPRCIYHGVSDKIVSCSLHSFGDSSAKAFCTAIYIVLETLTTRFVKLIAAKARVAPLSEDLSVPRLELLSGVITSKMANTVKVALGRHVRFNNCYYWLDAITALYWIKRPGEWKQFVSNRVRRIHKYTTPEDWRHVPGHLNPADLGTRGIDAAEFRDSSLWWDGPPFLKESQDNWPADITEWKPSSDCMKESRTNEGLLSKVDKVSVNLNVNSSLVNLENLLQIEKYSDVTKLYRVTAYVLRFIRNLKVRVQRTEEKLVVGVISTKEFNDAETLWIKEVQKDLHDIENYKQLERDLVLFRDEAGIVRCQGRLSNSSLPYSARYPILLPREKYLTMLIVRKCHNDVFHNKVKETLVQLRQRFWVPRARSLLRKIIFKCVLCRRLEGKSYHVPPPGVLPTFRVKEGHAFESVGCDLCGPVYCKTNTGTEKHYVVLFTCLTSRACHLELTPDLTAGSFLNSLKRFCARCGIPAKMVTDNAKYFKKTEKILQRLFKSAEINNFLAQKNIHWYYNLDRSPWMGGVFERLIQSIKRCLKKVLRTAILSEDEIRTIITEIESVLNSRPLTHVYTEQMEDILTPSHLMMGRRVLNLPDFIPKEDSVVDQEFLTRRMKYLSTLLKNYWKLWSKDYLTSIREYHKNKARKENTVFIKEGDIVVIYEEHLPRNFWRTGKIEKLIVSRDNEIRGAEVKCITKQGRPVTLNRPVQKLFPIEFSDSLNSELVEEKVELSERARPPRRNAALDAECLMKFRK